MTILGIICVLFTGAGLMLAYLQFTNRLRTHEFEKDYLELRNEHKANYERLQSITKELEHLQDENMSLKVGKLEQGNEKTVYEAKKAKVTANEAAISALLAKYMPKTE